MSKTVIGRRCTILFSQELLAMRLKRLVGRKGYVVDIPEHHQGVFVELDEEFIGEKEWYIPKASVQYCDL